MVGLSPAYFSRLFHRETGRTYAAFLLQARMDEATRLLSTTWLKVYEIAERVGVQSYRHFEVLYKKHTGSSPSAVRRPPKG
jgi:two-component system response regulator YesN